MSELYGQDVYSSGLYQGLVNVADLGVFDQPQDRAATAAGSPAAALFETPNWRSFSAGSPAAAMFDQRSPVKT